MNKETQIEILKFILLRARRAERKKAMLDNQLVMLRDKILHPIDGIQYKHDPIGGGGVNDGAADIPIKVAEIEEKIVVQMYEIVEATNAALDILRLLPANSDERIILSAYYIAGNGYEQIADDYHMNVTTVWRKMRSGLETIVKDEAVQTMISETEEEWRRSL